MAILKATGPFLGVNKAVDPSYLGPNEAQDALNVFLTYGTVWKRPGLKNALETFTDNPPILGIYDYLKVDTTNGGTTPIGLVKTGLTTEGAAAAMYRIDLGIDGLPAATDLGTSTLHSTNLASFLTANNRVYFCDGTAFKVWDGTTVYSAAVSGPSEGPSMLATGTTGILSGTYDYKITWYAPAWGIETPSSPVGNINGGSGPITVSSKTITVTNLGAQTRPDDRFTKIRIYRRRVSANETVWTYLAEVDYNTASYVDNVPDASVQASLDIAPATFDVTGIPAFQFMATQQDVVYASGADTAPTALYYSLAGQPWTLYQYLEVGSGADTDAVTGLAPFGGALVVFKERSIWVLTGNSLDTFDLKKVVPGIGCKSHHSIVEAGSLLMFLSEDGFFGFDGSSAFPLAGAVTQDPIRPDIRARNYSRDKCCVGGWDPDFGVVLWSYSSAGSSYNDKMYAFFPEHSKRVQYPSFVPQDMGGVSAMGFLTDQTTRERVLHLGRSDGVLGYLEGNADNGSAIQFRWKTGDFDAGEPFAYKIWKEFQSEVEPESTGEALAVTYYLDGSAVASALNTHATTRALSRARVSQSSRSISVEFSQSSDSPLEIRGWVLEHEKAGQA